MTEEKGFGSVDIYAEYSDGQLAKSSLCTYKEDDTVYASDISKDTAWHRCMEEKYSQGLTTDEEWEDAYAELTQSCIEEVTEEVEEDE